MSSNRILGSEERTPEKKLKESSSFASQNNSFSLKTSSSSTSSPSISNSHCQGDNYLIQRNDSFTTTNSKVLLFPTPFSFSLSTPIRFFPSKRRFTLNNKTRLNNVALCNSNNKFNSAIASIKEANFAKFEKIGGIANKALESDIGKIIFSRFGIPVDSTLESEYTEVEKRDKDGNVVTDEKGNVVTEKVLFKKDKKGNILNGKDSKPIIIKKKKSGLKNIGDGIVDISNVAFKAVGEISGIKGLVSSQSSAINTGKEKLNDLAKAIGVQGKNKGGALFKTEKMKAEEEEEAALESSVLSFEVSPDESAKTLEKINELVKRIKS